MANQAARELGKKGGQAKSAAKTEAARKNASKPRKPKPMPEFSSLDLLKFSYVELLTERRREEMVHGITNGGLYINGHQICEVLLHHIEKTYPEAIEWVAGARARAK